MAIVSSKSFEVVNEKTRRQRGPLIKVEIGPGQFRKMYRADAEEQGLVPSTPPPASPRLSPEGEKQGGGQMALGTKVRPAQGDKVRSPEEDKGEEGRKVAIESGGGVSVETEERAKAPEANDDLTVIAGVGRATSRLLAGRGVTTFEQLRTAVSRGAIGDFGLSAAALAAIEAWAVQSEKSE